MKNKKMIVAFLATLFAATTSAGVMITANAAEYDGTTNLATDASLWTKSWWTNEMNYANIDENGIKHVYTQKACSVCGLSYIDDESVINQEDNRKECIIRTLYNGEAIIGILGNVLIKKTKHTSGNED